MAKRQRQQRTSDRFGLIEIVLLLFFVVVLFNPQGGLTGLVGLEIVVPPGGTVEINLDAYFSEGYTYLATEGYGMDVVVEGSNLVVTAEPDFLGSTNLSVIGALGDTVETRSFTVQVEAGWNSVELAALNSPVSVSGEVVNEINLLGYSRAIVTADSDAFDDFIADETYIQGIGPQNDGMVVSSNGNQFDIVLSEQGFLKLAGDPGVSSIQEYEELSFGTSGFSTQAVGVANVTLVSSSGNNISADNLTVVFDANQSGVKNITNWFRNGSSVTLFNMPFENIGSDAGTRDYSGFGSDASENGGIAWSATGGHDGRGAYTYDGIDDYLSVPADVKWNFSGNFTILAWVNLGSLNRNFVKSVSNEDWNSASTNDWAFNVGSDGRMAFYVKNVGVGSSTATVSTNTWTHVAVVRDSGDIKFFKDGAATTNNIKFSTNVTAGNTQALQIGRIQTNLDFNMDGEIDELMIFNRTLSPEQIFTIYTNQSHIIVSNETVVGDIWSATVTPNDGIADGITVQSNNVTIAAPFVNTVPNITSIVLNATSVGNLTTDNLTVFFTTVDVDGNATKNITNWFRNGASITLLNMPFENNGSNSGILDHSGVGANGSETNGVVWSGTSGFDGRGAYEFDGLDDYLTIPASDRWNLTDGFTITVWVNLDTLNRNIVKSVSSQDWNTAATNDWAVNIGGDGRPAFNVKNVGASSGTDSVSTNVWTHLAIVRQVNGDIRFYKDGSLSPVGVALSVNGTIGNNQVLEIGRIESTLDFNMDGHLDELTIWNRTLSAEQILALYQNRTDLIVSNETVVGDIWSATVTPNDGQEDGLTVQSNNLTVLTPANTPPNITSILLNTTTGANLTSENLTVHFTVVDDDGNTTTNITNWFRNGTSVLPLNMPFEGGSNSTFTRDYTPFANDGVVTNAVFNASGGYDGLGSYIFDGTGDYITVADDNSLDVGTGSSTFTAWVLTSSSSITFIMSHGQGGTAVLRTIGVKASGRIDARIEDSGTTQIISTDDGSTFNDGQWHHIAVVFDRGNDVLVRYLDGIQTGTQDSLSTLSGNTDSTQPFQIGTLRNSGGTEANFWNGLIDDVRVYNRPLTAHQVRLLASNQTDRLSFNETVVGDIWSATVTPNDGEEDGVTVTSNNVVIASSIPEVFDLHPIAGTIFEINATVTISANVTDDTGVANVTANVTIPGGTIFKLNLTRVGSTDQFNVTFNNTGALGQYNVSLFANDTSGNINDTEFTFFVGNDTIIPEVIADLPSAGAMVNAFDALNISANVTDNGAVDVVLAQIVRPDVTQILTLSPSSGRFISEYANTSVVGSYTITYVANDTNNNVNNSVQRSFTVQQLGTDPNTTGYPVANGSTNFSQVPDLNNVSNMVLADDNVSLRFNDTVNASGKDYDTFVLSGVGFSSVNVTGLDQTVNQTTNVSYKGLGDCSEFDIFFQDGVPGDRQGIIDNGVFCNSTSDPSCTGISCVSGTFNFTASHWTGFASGVNGNLTIFDHNDTEGGGFSADLNTRINFTANYTNRTGSPINGTGVLCNISFGVLGEGSMTFDEVSFVYRFNRTFSSAFSDWNVTCNGTAQGFSTLFANDSLQFSINTLANITSISLNATSIDNLTEDNLTVHLQVTDADGNPVKNITNWFVNGHPLILANYAFENNANTSNFAVDYSPFSRNATVIGSPTFSATAGPDGFGAYTFDNNAEKIQLPDENAFDFTGDFSVETMFKWEPGGTGQGDALVAKHSCGSTNGWFLFMNEGTCSSDSISFFYSGSRTCSVTGLADGDWHHLVGIKNASHIQIFIDGNSTSTTVGSYTANSIAVQIGNLAGGSCADGSGFNGSVAFVRIYNRSLTNDQVQILNRNVTTVLDSSMTAFGDIWSMQVTPNDQEEDGLTVQSNNLTINLGVNLSSLQFNSTPTENDDVEASVNLTVDTGRNVTLTFNWTVNGSAVQFTTINDIPDDGILNDSLARSNYSRGLLVSVFVVANDSVVVDSRGFNVTVIGLPPNATVVFLNATTAGNTSLGNLTVHINASDPESDSIRNITNWMIEGQPVTLVNLPFEVGLANNSEAQDISGFNNNASVTNAIFNATGGPGGFGAYQFDGSGDSMALPSLDLTSATITAWVLIKESKTQKIFRGPSSQACLGTFGGNWERCGVSGSAFVLNRWYHVAIVEGEGIYIDGVLDIASTSGGLNGVLNIGGPPFSEFLNGNIAHIKIYNRTLTSSQLLILASNRTDVWAPIETRVGDNWSVNVTPVDGERVGTTVTSNTLLVTEHPSTPPRVIAIVPTAGTPFEANDTVNIQTNVTDPDGVANVTANVSHPNGAILKQNLTRIEGTSRFFINFTNTSTPGTYNVTLIANDTLGNINDTEFTFFISNDTTPPEVLIDSPAVDSVTVSGNAVRIAANVTDFIAVDTVRASILTPFGGTQVISLVSSVNDTFNNSFTNTTESLVYTITFIANDTDGNTNSTVTRQFNVSQVGIPPNSTEFVIGDGTTNFSLVGNLNSVNSMVLANTNTSVRWNGSVNASEQDFDTFMNLGFGFVTVNSSGLDPTLNGSANISIRNLVDCTQLDVFFKDGVPSTRNDILINGALCNSISDPSCTAIVCSGGEMNFTVSHFTGFASGANSQLLVYDQGDPEGGSQLTAPNTQIQFTANYSNLTSGAVNGSGVFCNITYNNDAKVATMALNATSGLYEDNRSFTIGGQTVTYNVSCDGSSIGITSLVANDDVVVTGGDEFCDIGDFTNTCFVTTSRTLTQANDTLILNNLNISATMTLADGTITNLSIIAAGNVTISGSIDANAAGFQGSGTSRHGGEDTGDDGGGGGYGGRGETRTGAGGNEHGSGFIPDDIGAEGGRTSPVNGGSGGGLITIQAGDTLELTGSIVANGGSGASGGLFGPNSGAGSGGGIYLNASTFQGDGTITANGGNGVGSPGSAAGADGGGGRIAVHYNTNTYTGTFSAVQGTAFTGSTINEGTVILYDKDDDSVIIPINTTYRLSEDDRRHTGNYQFVNFTIQTDATLDLRNQSEANAINISISVSDIFQFDSGAVITGTSRGHLGTENSEFGGANDSFEGGGGSYGGRGGTSSGAGGLEHGSGFIPVLIGSEGGLGGTITGGAGGGLLHIHARLANMSGALSMNGGTAGKASESGPVSGGGGGGGVFINASIFTGTGSIAAAGGSGVSTSVAGNSQDGGGGRIAIHFDTNTYTGTFDATPGNLNTNSLINEGTIIFFDRDDNSALIFVNTTYRLSEGDRAQSNNYTFANFTVQQGATLDIQNQSDADPTNISIVATDIFLLEGGATITGSGRGHLGDMDTASGGQDAPDDGGGGGYGGLGEQVTGVGGIPRGNGFIPDLVGSEGGKTGSVNGGAGGGLLHIQSRVAVINGTIRMNGGSGGSGGLLGPDSGGGSGGGLYINTSIFTGSGNLTAKGGGSPGSPGSGAGGDGSGGRIAVHFNTNTFTGRINISQAISGSSQSAPLSREGSAILYDKDDNSVLIYQNTTYRMQESDRPFTNNYSFANITVQGDSIWDLENQSDADPTNFTIRISDTFLIEPGAIVTASGRGHSFNGTTTHGGVDGAGSGGGGGHGGAGEDQGQDGGEAFDDPVLPAQIGAEGGAGSTISAGAGAGLLYIFGGTLNVSGVLRSDGDGGTGANSDPAGGGGAGGTIYINVTLLTGDGSITANGGGGGGVNSGLAGGDGGGGRIAIEFVSSTFNGSTSASPGGTAGGAGAGAGTIAIRTPVTLPTDSFTAGLTVNLTGLSNRTINSSSNYFGFNETVDFIDSQRGLLAGINFLAVSGITGVNLTTMVITSTPTATAINLDGVVNIANNHTLYVNNSNNGKGIFVCPFVTEAILVKDDCVGKVDFPPSFPKNKTVQGLDVLVAIIDGRYKVVGLNGTGIATASEVNLTIFDHNDTLGGGLSANVGEQIRFFANYTNKTSAVSINGTNAFCNITTEPFVNINMTFNETSLVYEFNRTFSSGATFGWNVTCTAPNFGQIFANDTITITDAGAPGADFCDVGNFTTTCTINTAKALTQDNDTLTLNNLNITSTGSLTLTDGTITNLTITATGNVTILGPIDAVGSGFQGTDDSANGGEDDAGGTNSAGGGGAHRGRGGNAGSAVGARSGGLPHGSSFNPFTIGSEGGESGGGELGGKGGGLVRIQADGFVEINSTISADGTQGGNNGIFERRGGGGAGGAVFINASSIKGIGNISADGAASQDIAQPSKASGAGGGGIIALHYDTFSLTGTLSADQGTEGSNNPSGADNGSVVRFDKDNSILTVPSNTSFILVHQDVPTTASFNTLTVESDAVMKVENMSARNFTISLSTLTVEGEITGTGLGHQRPDNGTSPGVTRSGTNVGGDGGAHGGGGGQGTTAANTFSGIISPAYGDVLLPTFMGSVGGLLSGRPDRGLGGNRLHFQVSGTTTVNGVISSDGISNVQAFNTAGGAGAGGTIFLNTTTLTGSGTIRAVGGPGFDFASSARSGSGGGGRIALEYTTNTFTGLVNVSGGKGATGSASFGGDGTAAIRTPVTVPTDEFTSNMTINMTGLSNRTINATSNFFGFNETGQFIDSQRGILAGLEFIAVSRAGVNLGALMIDADETRTVFNLSGVTNIGQNNSLFLNNSNNGVGLFVCPNVEVLSDVLPSCSGVVQFLSPFPRNKSVNGRDVTVRIVGDFYKAENLNGTGIGTSELINLTIFDQNDTLGGGLAAELNSNILFFANFTNGTSGAAINVTGSFCNITVDTTVNQNMSFNSTSLVYQFSRSFSTIGTRDWNVTCTAPTFGTVFANDMITISQDLFPSVTNVRPTSGTNVAINSTVNITAEVTDDILVDTVLANVTGPSGNFLLPMTLLGGTTYNVSFVNTSSFGQYNVTIIANDTANQINNTESTFFVASDSSAPTVVALNPAAGQSFDASSTINITANVTDNAAVDAVFVNVTKPDGSIVQVTLVLTSGITYNNTFNDTSASGTYTVRYIANDTSGNVNSGTTRDFTIGAPAAPPPTEGGGPGGTAPTTPPAPPAAVAPPSAVAPAAAAAPAAAPRRILPRPVKPISYEVFKETPIACAFLVEGVEEGLRTEEVEMSPLFVIPDNFTAASKPFRFACSGQDVDLTVSVPNTFEELEALRCNAGGCVPIGALGISNEDILCGDTTLTELRIAELLSVEEWLQPESFDEIQSYTRTVTVTEPVISVGKYVVRFREITEDVIATMGSPIASVREPANPNARIVGTPITLSGPYSGKVQVTVPYTPAPDVEEGSLALYKQTVEGWEALDSVLDKENQLIVAETVVGGPEELFAVLGIVCDSCTDIRVKQVYDGGTRDAIFLLHGFMSRSSTWSFIEDDFVRNRQPYQLWTIEYPSSSGITDLIDEVYEHLEGHANEYDDIKIVGHSLGGFITQGVLAKAQENNAPWLSKVSDAILVGNPNEGSPVGEQYGSFWSQLMNLRRMETLFDPASPMADVLGTGWNVPRAEGVNYYVVAGTKPYELRVGDRSVSTADIAGITGVNDGITNVTSTQHVGSTYIRELCTDYFEVGVTHTATINAPIGRKVIERILTRELYEQGEQAVGYTQYFRFRVDSCTAEDQYVIIGKPIEPEKAAGIFACTCGNGVCGVDENELTCPSDCLFEEEAMSWWWSLLWLIVLIGLLHYGTKVIKRFYDRESKIAQKWNEKKSKKVKKWYDDRTKIKLPWTIIKWEPHSVHVKGVRTAVDRRLIEFNGWQRAQRNKIIREWKLLGDEAKALGAAVKQASKRMKPKTSIVDALRAKERVFVETYRRERVLSEKVVRKVVKEAEDSRRSFVKRFMDAWKASSDVSTGKYAIDSVKKRLDVLIEGLKGKEPVLPDHVLEKFDKQARSAERSFVERFRSAWKASSAIPMPHIEPWKHVSVTKTKPGKPAKIEAWKPKTYAKKPSLWNSIKAWITKPRITKNLDAEFRHLSKEVRKLRTRKLY